LEKVLTDYFTEIDDIYQAGMAAGAVGGKILGAGGGGFILFFVPPEHQATVRERLKHLVYVPIKMDDSGSKVVLYEPQMS
jgi:D-glycero-alpha-D-manno-heptose-7-phosphate kinase